MDPLVKGETASLSRISVIVAVRNAEATLAKTLESILSQDYPNKEIILVDGASTDRTLEVARRFRDQLDVFVSEPDKGIADAYNKGIRRANGDWIYFLNADDLFFRTTTLSELFRRSLADEDYDLIVGKVLADDGRLLAGRFTWTLMMRNNVHHQAIFYRGSLLKSLEYNAAYKRYGHDHEHNLALWKSRARVLYVETTIARWSTDGISNNARWKDYREEFRARRNVLGRAAWFWNFSTYARYAIKRTRAALRAGSRP